MTAAAVPVIGCGILTNAGVGLEALGAARSRTAAPVAADELHRRLGRRGLTRLTRSDQLFAAACVDAVGNEPPHGPFGDGLGVVVGVSTGSALAQEGFVHDIQHRERPFDVNPADFPGTLMNSAASRTAIRFDARAVNSTIAGGALATLDALAYARRCLLDGRARHVLAGGVEEVSPTSRWGWRAAVPHPRRRPAEAAGAFLLAAPAARPEDPGRGPVLGLLLGGAAGFADPAGGLGGVSRRLAGCIGTALRRAGVPVAEVTAVVPGAAGRPGWWAVEERALRSSFAGGVPHRLTVGPAVGETYAATGAVQLAALLAGWADTRVPSGVAVLTGVGFDGSVACTVVSHPDHPRRAPGAGEQEESRCPPQP